MDIDPTLEKKIKRISKISRQEKRRLGQEPDQVDRIQQHLVEGVRLKKKKDQDLLEKALHIYPLLCSGKTQNEILRIIDNAGWGKQRKGYTLIRLTKKIFFFQDDFSDLGKRNILIEMCKKAYKKAEEEGKPGAMIAAVKTIAQLEGVLDQNDSYSVVFQNLQLPPLIVSDNPNVIDMPVEEIPFEEE